MTDSPHSSSAVNGFELLDLLSEQIVVIDVDGRVIYANATWRRFADQHFSADWGDASVLASYRGVGDAVALEHAVSEVFKGQSDQLKCTIVLKTMEVGQVILAQVSLYETANGRYVLIQQHAATGAAELDRQRELTRVMLDNLSDAVVACDAEGRLILFNRVARQWHNLTPDERLNPDEWAEKYDLYATDGVTLLAADDIPLLRAFKGEQVRDAPMVIHARNQPPRFVEASGDPLIDDRGEKLGAVVVMHDITDRKDAERSQRELQELLIRNQEEVLSQLSTPLFPINQQTLVMPLIGTVDSRRASQILETLLNDVAQTHAQVVILDITGVPIVDSQVANTFVQAAQAVGLLGAEMIITGIRPEVAQTMVGLGINLASMITLNTLESGITYAIKRLRQ